MNQARWMIGVTFGAALLAGCGGSDNSIDQVDGGSGGNTGGSSTDNDGADDGVSTATVDATSNDTSTYFNLETGAVVELSAAEAAASTAWHLAFRRYNVQLNGGASGPGQVVGAIGDGQAEFYDGNGDPVASVFMNATPNSELEHLLAEFAEPASWTSDVDVSALGDDWYSYNYTTHAISENAANGYLIRSAGGNSYARMEVTDLYNIVTTMYFELSFDVQGVGESQFTGTVTFSGNLPSAGGEKCFDFDTGNEVDCASSDAWDIQFGYQDRNLYLRTNSGPFGNGNGGALGPFDRTELAGYTSATTNPGGQSLAGLYVADGTGGVFVDNSWYAYNIGGAHQLWPNYRVYLIDTDSSDDASPIYALQITGYYGDDGASGQPVIRWREVTLTEAN